MRKKIIIGNWKMTLTNSEAVNFIRSIKELINLNKAEFVVCPSYTAISDVKKAIGKKAIKLGAQNVHFEKSGAYTGEISIDMLKDLDVKYVILGHSERRNKLEETDDIINKKVKLSLESGITPIICVGENTEERISSVQIDKVEFQIRKALDDVDIRDVSNVIIAYEPVWAISTSSQNIGIAPDGNLAEEMAENIRYIIEKLYGTEVAENIRIIYGGSVSSDNTEEYLSKQNIDGLLIGAKSIKPDIVKVTDIANKI